MNSIQIFSPHIDDAVLSLGGCILNWRGKGLKIKINNIFTISNWTHTNPISDVNYGKNISRVTELRKTEERNLANNLQYEYEFWDFLDCPLRHNFSPTDIQNMENQICDRIKKKLNKKDSFFFPLGIDHPDHILVKKLSSFFINKGYKIYFYEDLPYFSWGGFDYQKSYVICSKDKSPELVKINFEQKASFVKKYGSQINETFIENMRAYAYNKADNYYYERYWKQL